MEEWESGMGEEVDWEVLFNGKSFEGNSFWESGGVLEDAGDGCTTV